MCVSLSMAWQCLQHGIDRPCRRYRSLVSTTLDVMVPSHRARLIEVGTLASVKVLQICVTLNTVDHNLPRKLHHHIIPPQTLLYWKVSKLLTERLQLRSVPAYSRCNLFRPIPKLCLSAVARCQYMAAPSTGLRLRAQRATSIWSALSSLFAEIAFHSSCQAGRALSSSLR